jgi:phosphoribosyl-AMP cyclohydrolase
MDKLKFNDQGLIPVIVQEAGTGEVLMLAWMNQQALDLTIATKRATYWSRSRSKLWVKGETSGHYQTVKEIRYDCDADTLLLLVEQQGAACHTGSKTCFYRQLPIKEECTHAEHL